MKLIFIHGPAASGKHTIGKLLSDELGIPLFHNHLVVDVARCLFEFGEPGFVKIRENMWQSCFREAAKARKSFIFTFNPERTVALELIENLVGLYEAEGGKVLYIELLCSDQEVLRRIGNESRKQFGKLTDGKIYKAFKNDGGFDFPSLPDPLLRIDTEANTPRASVDLIVQSLKSEPGGAGNA